MSWFFSSIDNSSSSTAATSGSPAGVATHGRGKHYHGSTKQYSISSQHQQKQTDDISQLTKGIESMTLEPKPMYGKHQVSDRSKGGFSKATTKADCRQPIEEILRRTIIIAFQKGGRLVSQQSRSAGVLPISVRQSTVDPSRKEIVVLLGLEYRYNVGKKVLTDFGGIRDAGETIRGCALREMSEETGYAYDHDESDEKVEFLADLAVSRNYHSFMLPVAYIPQEIIKEKSDVQRKLSHSVEKSNYHWFNLQELCQILLEADTRCAKRRFFNESDILISIDSKQRPFYSRFADILFQNNRVGITLLLQINEIFLNLEYLENAAPSSLSAESAFAEASSADEESENIAKQSQ